MDAPGLQTYIENASPEKPMATKTTAPKTKTKALGKAAKLAAESAPKKASRKRGKKAGSTSAASVTILRVSGYDVVVNGPVDVTLMSALDAFIAAAQDAGVISLCEIPGL